MKRNNHLPANWHESALEDCCDIVSGSTPSREVASYWGGSIPWVTPKDLNDLEGPEISTTPECITDDGYRSCSTQMLPTGAVLFSSRAPIGLIAIAGRPMCTNQGFKSFIPKPGLDSRYLYHCLKRMVPYIQALGNGATFKEVSKAVIGKVKIPVPQEEAEQKRIAAVLDKAEAIRRKRKKCLLFVDNLLCAAFLEAFGDPARNPKGWQRVPIGRYGTVVTGNTPSRTNPAYYGEEIEWVKSDNLNTPYPYATKAAEGLSKLGKAVGRIAPAGSVLVTCIAGSPDCIGNAAIVDREVAFNQQINAVIPGEKTDTGFLYALMHAAKPLIQAASTEAMKGMVSKSKFEAVSVIDVPFEQQSGFGRLFKRLVECQAKARSSEAMANDLFASLVQRAFRGDL